MPTHLPQRLEPAPLGKNSSPLDWGYGSRMREGAVDHTGWASLGVPFPWMKENPRKFQVTLRPIMAPGDMRQIFRLIKNSCKKLVNRDAKEKNTHTMTGAGASEGTIL